MTLAENVGLPLGEFTDLRLNRSARSRRSSWRWSALRGSRISIPTKSAAACRSAPDSRARWRWIRRFYSSTSLRRASTRLARALLDELILRIA